MNNTIGKEQRIQQTGVVPPRKREEWLAHLLSEVMSPVFVALPTFFGIAFATAPNTWDVLLWWAITVVGISAGPFLFILRGVRRGQ
jgi:hypothetical protein